MTDRELVDDAFANGRITKDDHAFCHQLIDVCEELGARADAAHEARRRRIAGVRAQMQAGALARPQFPELKAGLRTRP